MSTFFNFVSSLSEIAFYDFFVDSWIFKIFFALIILSVLLLVLRGVFRG